MNIVFANDAIEKLCNDSKEATRRLGSEPAKRLRLRIQQLLLAGNLEVMRRLPGRCHEHQGRRPPELTVDLDGPYRLVFEAAHDPAPLKPDGGLDWSEVNAIRILRIEDPHGP